MALRVRGREPTARPEGDLAEDGEEGRDQEADARARDGHGANPAALLLIALRQEERYHREEERGPDDRGQDDVHAMCTQR